MFYLQLTARHAMMPSPAYWGSQSLGESPVPGLSEGKVPGETPKACDPFILPSPIPWTNPSCFNTHSVEGGFIHRWGDPKEGGWRWEPQHQETWSPRGFSKLFQPRAPHPLGAVGVVSLQEDPLDLEVVGPCRGEQACQVHGGRAHWLVYPPQVRQPHGSPSLGTKPAQASGMYQQPRAPRPEGNRVSILFL